MTSSIIIKSVVRKEHRVHKTSKKALIVMGKNLVKRRHELGIGQGPLAKSIKISFKTLSNIENGRSWPSMPVYLAICRELQLDAPPLTELPRPSLSTSLG